MWSKNTEKTRHIGLKTPQFPWSLPCWKAQLFCVSTSAQSIYVIFPEVKNCILLTVKTTDLKEQVWELNIRWLPQDQQTDNLTDPKIFGSCVASVWFHALKDSSAHDKHNLSLEGVEPEDMLAKRKNDLQWLDGLCLLPSCSLITPALVWSPLLPNKDN